MIIFLTGSTGFVGSHVLQALVNEGHKVKALIREGPEGEPFATNGVTIVKGDANKPEEWEEALTGVDAVINLIGVIREFPASGITFERLHYEATVNLVDVAKKSGVSRFIQMSANGARAFGVSSYQTTKWRAEQYLKASGLNWTIFRPSVIFGDSRGRMEFTAELAKVIKILPVTPIFGDGNYQLDPVAVMDVAHCFTKALMVDAAKNKIFHLGYGTPLPYREVIQTIGKALGKQKVLTINIPFFVVSVLASLLDGFKFFPVTEDQLKMLAEGNVTPEDRWKKVFEIEPKPFVVKNMSYLK